MFHATLNRGFDQRAGVHGIVAVIAKRIAQRIRDHDRSGEMDDGANFMIADNRCHEVLVAHVADAQRYGLRQRRAEAGRQIVEHHDRLAGVCQRVNHVASDITGAASDQNGHLFILRDR